MSLSDVGRQKISELFEVHCDCGAESFDTIVPTFISRENNFLLIDTPDLLSAGNLYLFFPKNFHVSYMMLSRYLSLPNLKSMVINESFLLPWFDILSPQRFTIQELDRDTDFVQFVLDKNEFTPVVPSLKHYFLYQVPDNDS